MKPLSVLILHHAIPAHGSGPSAESDAGVMDEVHAVAAALETLGFPHRTAAIQGLADLPALLRLAPESVVFNLVESLPEHPADAALVPAVCSTFRKGCTGNDTACQSLGVDKWRTKGVLTAAGLPVPAGALVPVGHTASGLHLPKGKVIVKPLLADASEGIHADSVVSVGPALARAVRRIHREFSQTALVEAFFGTRELNVSVIQRGQEPEVLPIAEIEFRGYGHDRPHIVDYAAKWHPESFEYRNTVRVIPARLPAPLIKRIQRCAVAAWKALGCADYARVDLRLTAKGEFAVLEVNPNPDIAPESGFAAALQAAGIPFAEFVHLVCRNAAARIDVRAQGCRSAPTGASPDAQPSLATPEASRGSSGGASRQIRRSAQRRCAPAAIRYTCPADREPILDFIRATKFFRDGELDIAREVLDDALKQGPEGHYQSFTLVNAQGPVGWVCLGPTPCTEGTFDVYWLGVAPTQQGKGYGRALLDHAEAVIRKRKGRLIVIETSGHSLYDSTRGFYLTLGYREVARVPDFYNTGDARVIYTKSVSAR